MDKTNLLCYNAYQVTLRRHFLAESHLARRGTNPTIRNENMMPSIPIACPTCLQEHVVCQDARDVKPAYFVYNPDWALNHLRLRCTKCETWTTEFGSKAFEAARALNLASNRMMNPSTNVEEELTIWLLRHPGYTSAKLADEMFLATASALDRASYERFAAAFKTTSFEEQLAYEAAAWKLSES